MQMRGRCGVVVGGAGGVSSVRGRERGFCLSFENKKKVFRKPKSRRHCRSREESQRGRRGKKGKKGEKRQTGKKKGKKGKKKCSKRLRDLVPINSEPEKFCGIKKVFKESQHQLGKGRSFLRSFSTIFFSLTLSLPFSFLFFFLFWCVNSP